MIRSPHLKKALFTSFFMTFQLSLSADWCLMSDECSTDAWVIRLHFSRFQRLHCVISNARFPYAAHLLQLEPVVDPSRIRPWRPFKNGAWQGDSIIDRSINKEQKKFHVGSDVEHRFLTFGTLHELCTPQPGIPVIASDTHENNLTTANDDWGLVLYIKLQTPINRSS